MHAPSSRDLDRLSESGISRDEAERQIELLCHPPAGVELVRPCTVGDGIERIALDAFPELHARHDRAAAEGAITAFIPASGAASRMFRDLMAYCDDPRTLTRSELESDRDDGRPGAYAVLEFAEGLDRFAFRDALEHALADRGYVFEELVSDGPYRPVIDTLLAPDGLDYARLPKALVPFHAYADGARTAFEEHLSEAAALYRDRDERVRVHATIPIGTRDGFDARAARARSGGDARLDVTFSVQDPSTDTLALDESGEPFRDASGRLVLRPSGHGALLRNLARVESPVAFIRNIDNIAAQPFRESTRGGTRTLIGRLCALRDQAPDGPSRVCGVVPNTGEPGGGPFWVRGADRRVTPQIVESSQVRFEDERQRAIWLSATHFNPVLIACSLEDGRGRRYDLDRFVDERAAIVTRRSWEGRDLTVLERPGLWNGGMAGWNTVFVEVPLAMFTPVKVVNDLLRPEHQP